METSVSCEEHTQLVAAGNLRTSAVLYLTCAAVVARLVVLNE